MRVDDFHKTIQFYSFQARKLFSTKQIQPYIANLNKKTICTGTIILVSIFALSYFMKARSYCISTYSRPNGQMSWRTDCTPSLFRFIKRLFDHLPWGDYPYDKIFILDFIIQGGF